MNRAEDAALNLLPRHDLTDEERVRLEVLLGSIYVAKNDSSGAYDAFQRAIRVQPDLSLNPSIFSPKILTVFNQAKHDLIQPHTYTTEQLFQLETADLRNQGFPSGILWPGWGLYRQKKTLHGTIFTVIEGVALLGAAWATVSTNQASTDYHSATASNANKRWSDYRDWFHRRNALWIATGAIHGIGLLDLSFGNLPEPAKVNIALVPSGIRLSFSLK